MALMVWGNQISPRRKLNYLGGEVNFLIEVRVPILKNISLR
jgi:hypothetical protein